MAISLITGKGQPARVGDEEAPSGANSSGDRPDGDKPDGDKTDGGNPHGAKSAGGNAPPLEDRSTRWWRRGTFTALVVVTATLYLWNLSINGWANSFYAAAIQAGSQSWKAWFFGASDMAGSITVDKPPASLWIPALSVRILGLNSWSMLVPEALMGVASVALLYALTRRYFGHWAGIAAGAALALTPVAALMFRFNNPEALLVLLMIAAVWSCLRAVETGRLRWMVLTGVLVGFGFLTKQLQVMLIVPPMALTFLAFGAPRWARRDWLRRIGHLFAALGAMIVSAGWWILAVEVWPADSRPWIGGSQNNSILELTLGYNGLGRLNGNETGSVTPGGGMPGGAGMPGGGIWGESGWLRMFDSEQGGQIAWLIPAAMILSVAALFLLRRVPRTDLRRAYLAVWGLWLLVTMAVFSFMAGIFHAYYTAALAPAVAATLAGGAAVCWRHRDRLWVRLALAAVTIGTAEWSFVLLARTADFLPWLRVVVLIVGVLAGIALICARPTPASDYAPHQRSLRGRLIAVVAALAIAAGMAGPVAYTVNTVVSAHSGSIITASPQLAGGPGGLRGMPPPDTLIGRGQAGPGGPGWQAGPGGQGGLSGQGGPSAQGGLGAQGGPDGQGGLGGPGMPDMNLGAGGVGPRGGGGLLNGSESSPEITALLSANGDSYTWVAAAIGSNSASGYQLATGYSVMPIGGFNGTDPSPTLEEFQQYVANGEIHYFIAGGMGGGMGSGSSASSSIATWVQENFTATTVDGVTLYDMTSRN